MGETTTARPDATDVLSLLADPEARAILELTATTARSVGELVEECGLPTSTAYRKVEALVEAGLLEERVRIQPERRNPREYLLRKGEITLKLNGAGKSLPDYDLDVDAGMPAACEACAEAPPQPEVSTDGGEIIDEAEADANRFQALFLDVTGTEEVVEEQASTAATRYVDADTASAAARAATAAREDGLTETIDEPDDSPTG